MVHHDPDTPLPAYQPNPTIIPQNEHELDIEGGGEALNLVFFEYRGFPPDRGDWEGGEVIMIKETREKIDEEMRQGRQERAARIKEHG